MPSLTPLIPRYNHLFPGAPLVPGAPLMPGFNGPTVKALAEDTAALTPAAQAEGTQTLVALAEQAFSQTIEGGTWPSLATFPSAATFPSVRTTVTTPGPVLDALAESTGALVLTPLAET